MIKQIDKAYYLAGESSSLLIWINEIGKPVTLYFGPHIEEPKDLKPFLPIIPCAQGSSTIYDEKKAPTLSLDSLDLDLSTPYKGDYGDPSLLIEGMGSPIYDFVFERAEIRQPHDLTGLPSPHGGEDELILFLRDSKQNVEAELHYLTYRKSDVIGRYLKINNEGSNIVIRKAASLQLILNGTDFEMVSFYGGWAGEFQKEVTPLTHVRSSFDSSTGSSSARHNPFFIIKKKNTDFENGLCYGFNLVYSGNHLEEAELSSFGKLRIQNGISPLGFAKHLKKGESFITPLAIMAVSSSGLNGLTHIMHDFVNEHVVAKEFAFAPRPIAYNNWEATFMKFNERKLHALAKKAASLGIELFVLDDGWFGKRDDDTSSLGDWKVDLKKLPHGLQGLSKYVHKLGMKFGLWFEPEMVSPNSDLYRAHPEFAIQDGLHEPSLGRHQLNLDLTKKEVRDYIVETVSGVLLSTSIDFVKWDYNRNISDLPVSSGEFFHDYILGLYEVMTRLTERFPKILFENCASGGNRCDLGMLSFFPQTWVSDDTDSFERTKIQEGMVLGYPLSTMSNHVAAKTSGQMLRKTSFGTKFDVACMGVLGYELDINDINGLESDEIHKEIALYKENREVFQYGIYDQLESIYEGSFSSKEVHKGDKAFVSKTLGIQTPHPSVQTLRLVDLEPKALYSYGVRSEGIDLKKFGAMINYVSPIHIKEDGNLIALISRHKEMPIEKVFGTVSGSALNAGTVQLPPLWNGTGYGEEVAFLGDFGSRLYIVEKTKKK